MTREKTNNPEAHARSFFFQTARHTFVMDIFRSVLTRMRCHAEFRDQRLAAAAEAAALDAQLRAEMHRSRKPLCLVASPSNTVIFKGSPLDILVAFAALEEDVHPASVCLSVRAVMRSIRKHQPNERRPKKRRKTAEASGATLLVS